MGESGRALCLEEAREHNSLDKAFFELVPESRTDLIDETMPCLDSKLFRIDIDNRVVGFHEPFWCCTIPAPPKDP